MLYRHRTLHSARTLSTGIASISSSLIPHWHTENQPLSYDIYSILGIIPLILKHYYILNVFIIIERGHQFEIYIFNYSWYLIYFWFDNGYWDMDVSEGFE